MNFKQEKLIEFNEYTKGLNVEFQVENKQLRLSGMFNIDNNEIYYLVKGEGVDFSWKELANPEIIETPNKASELFNYLYTVNFCIETPPRFQHILFKKQLESNCVAIIPRNAQYFTIQSYQPYNTFIQLHSIVGYNKYGKLIKMIKIPYPTLHFLEHLEFNNDYPEWDTFVKNNNPPKYIV